MSDTQVELREILKDEIKYRVEQEYQKYHNQMTFDYNGLSFWREQIENKLSDTLVSFITAHTNKQIEAAERRGVESAARYWSDKYEALRLKRFTEEPKPSDILRAEKAAVESVLDRLETSVLYIPTATEDIELNSELVPMSAIEAERKRLGGQK